MLQSELNRNEQINPMPHLREQIRSAIKGAEFGTFRSLVSTYGREDVLWAARFDCKSDPLTMYLIDMLCDASEVCHSYSEELSSQRDDIKVLQSKLSGSDPDDIPF